MIAHSSRFRRFAGIGLLVASLGFGSPTPVALLAQESVPSLEQLQKRLQEDPDDKEALLSLAMRYTLDKNYLKAVETYFRLLKIDPRNFHAHHNLGILYKKVGQFNDSLHCYQEALRINPNSGTVHYNMGLAYEAMGRMQEAREAYGRALSLNPDLTQALARLRELSDEPGAAPSLPKPEAVLIVDSPTGPAKPVTVAGSPSGEDGSKPSEPPKKSEKPGKSEKTEKPEKTAKGGDKPPADAPEPDKPATPKTGSGGKSQMVRTLRQGPGVGFYHQALDALEKEDLKTAIEQYVLCILKDRDFLSEPDSGLIQQGIAVLRDRPNMMPDALFYRAFLVSLSGPLETAVPDLKLYLEKTKNPAFQTEAQAMLDKYQAQLDALAAAQKAASDAAAIALAQRQLQGASGTASFTPRPDDTMLQKMNVDEILEESRKLSRDGRYRDAIAVLRAGLDKDQDNLQLLMSMGNAYTDMMLMKNDGEAGAMAKSLFEKVISLAPPESKEAKVAVEMLKELAGGSPQGGN